MVASNGSNPKPSIEQPITLEYGRADLSKVPNCDNKDSLWCTYCKKARHTREKCWKLHGKPSTSSKKWGYKGRQPRNSGQAYVTSATRRNEISGARRF